MDTSRGSSGGSVATGFGAAVALVVYVLVAPFKCSRGTCDGLVAFHYQPDSAGHLQAIGAAVLVGGAAALLLWLVLGPDRHKAARLVATPLLIAGIGVSVLSHSVLFIVGPLVGGVVLWLMWFPPSWQVSGNSNPEPDPFYSRR